MTAVVVVGVVEVGVVGVVGAAAARRRWYGGGGGGGSGGGYVARPPQPETVNLQTVNTLLSLVSYMQNFKPRVSVRSRDRTSASQNFFLEGRVNLIRTSLHEPRMQNNGLLVSCRSFGP